MRSPLPLSSALLCTLLLSACGPAVTTGTSASSAAPTLSVAVSFYPLAFLANEIGGNLINLTQITPGGVEPHDYEPSPQDLAAVQNANIFLMNGAGVDPWADAIHDDLVAQGTTVLTMTARLPVLSGFVEEGAADHLHPSSTGSTISDPHLWLDPVIMQKEAVIVRDAFIAADPAHKTAYTANARAFVAELAVLDKDYRAGLKTCTVRTAVVSHNAFRYLAKEYSFETLAISGLSPEEEPSAKHIAELADFAKSNGIKYIFFETLVSPKLAETVAGEIGAEALVLNPIEGLTPEQISKGEDYLSIMRENLKNLRTALQCP